MLRKENRTQESKPRNHIRKVHTGRVESSLLDTVKRTSSTGDCSFSVASPSSTCSAVLDLTGLSVDSISGNAMAMETSGKTQGLYRIKYELLEIFLAAVSSYMQRESRYWRNLLCLGWCYMVFTCMLLLSFTDVVILLHCLCFILMAYVSKQCQLYLLLRTYSLLEISLFLTYFLKQYCEKR